MSLPKPKSKETKKDFITRCMASETMRDKYSDRAERLAVSNSLYTPEKKEFSELSDKLFSLMKGDKGDQGKPGLSIKGEKGDPGESVKGDQGEKGDKGEQGEVDIEVLKKEVRSAIPNLDNYIDKARLLEVESELVQRQNDLAIQIFKKAVSEIPGASAIARNLELLPEKDKLDPEKGLKDFKAAVRRNQFIGGGGGSEGGASTFLQLLDTPSTYVGSEQRFVKVNTAGTALEFVAGSGVAVAWGDITGNIVDQADLQSELDGKADLVHTHTASQITDFAAAVAANTEVTASSVLRHARQHFITSSADHTSSATAGRILQADVNGLPVNASNTDVEVAAAVAASHAAVTVVDTASIDITLTGQQLSAVVLPGGVDHNSLANLTTGNPHSQYFLAANASTTNIVEGTNLYFTDERAQDAVGNSLGAGLNYTDGTGAIAANTATSTQQGIVELAIASEINTGTDTTRAITPDAFAGSEFGIREVGIQVVDGATVPTTGDGKAYFRIPVSMNGMNLIRAAIQVLVASTTGTTSVMIARGRQVSPTVTFTFVDMLSTAITIDVAEFDSKDATTPLVINGSNDDVATGDVIRFDVDAVGTSTVAMNANLSFQLP